METDDRLSGRRVMVVEDWSLIADAIGSMLRRLDCRIVGPVARLDRALALARTEPLDGAVLDVDLDGVEVFPVADALAERGVPCIFSTGYDAGSALPARFGQCPCLEKPFGIDALAAALRRASGSASAR